MRTIFGSPYRNLPPSPLCLRSRAGLCCRAKVPVLVLHGSIITTCLCVAVYIVWNTGGSPVFGFGYLFTAVILCMKLVSYAHANRDLRLAWRARARNVKSRGETSCNNASAIHGTGDEWRAGGGASTRMVREGGF